MIIKGPQLNRAIEAALETRLFLFYGPDEGASRALMKRIVQRLGEDSERVDLAASELKSDPARLPAEAAAFSMFGASRYILVDQAGDELAASVTALNEAPVAGNPVILLAGDLKKSSRLLKLVSESKDMVAFASYVPDSGKADRLVLDLAASAGLIVQRDVASRIAEACGGHRAVIAQELDKYALYLGASPEASRPLDHEIVDVLGAGADSGDLSRLVDSVAEGDSAALEAELVRLRAEGQNGIVLIRALLRRMLLIARLRAEVELGKSPSEVMASSGKALFWKEKEPVARQLSRWRPKLLSKAVSRLVEAERQVKASGGIGDIAADSEAFAICRQAARLR